MKKFIKIFCSFLSLALLGGCGEDEIKTFVSFHIGSSSNVMGVGSSREPIEMEGSKFRLLCDPNPFIYSGDLERVDVARVDTPDGMKIDGFYFKCDIDGTRKLLAVTASNLNNFIVMKINGVPMGLRRIDTIISDGMLFVIADVPMKTVLQKVADDINESIVITNEIKRNL